MWYDRFLWPLEQLALQRVRRRLLARASGRILELAVGTGGELPLYPPDACAVGLDADYGMALVAQQRSNGTCMKMLQADAARLPFPDGHFDTVVSTLLYCSLDEPAMTLGEIRRVLRPNGQLLMMEHVRGQPPLMSVLTDAANIPWHAVTRTCHLNRRPADDLAGAGFTILSEERSGLSLIQMIVAAPSADRPLATYAPARASRCR